MEEYEDDRFRSNQQRESGEDITESLLESGSYDPQSLENQTSTPPKFSLNSFHIRFPKPQQRDIPIREIFGLPVKWGPPELLPVQQPDTNRFNIKFPEPEPEVPDTNNFNIKFPEPEPEPEAPDTNSFNIKFPEPKSEPEPEVPDTNSFNIKFPEPEPKPELSPCDDLAPSMKFPYDPLINTENGSDHSCFISIESKLNQIVYKKSSDWSICKVPNSLRSLKPDEYTPQLVSIGPVHHKKDSPLQAMERHKLGYMQCLLNRTRTPKATLSQCTQAVLEFEQKARSCYSDNALDDDDHGSIAEILLVDACFVVELLLKFSEYTGKKDDPLFSNVWMVAALQRDLSLLENQIPFFVLESLYQITSVDLDHAKFKISKLAFDFFDSAIPLNHNSFTRHIENEEGFEFRHLLDLVHKCLEPEESVTELCKGYYKKPPDEDECLMPTLGELVDSGVKIRRGDASDLLGIKFEEDSGTLVIPELSVGDMTEMLLRNLVAYEQYCGPGGRHVTSYVLLMDRLIDNEGDVEVLDKARVLNNSLGHFGRVADLFNDLGMEMVTTPNDKIMFSEVCVKVDEYCSRWLPKNMAILRREYFPNVWQIVGFVIAFLMLALTVQQSIYTIIEFNEAM